MGLEESPSHAGLRGIQKIQADRKKSKIKEEKQRQTLLESEQRRPWVSPSILDTVSDAMFATGHMNKDVQDTIEEATRLERTTSEVDAATKLQSCQRRNMAMKKANSLREEKT